MNASLLALGSIDSGATTIYADVGGSATAAGDPPFANRFITLSADYALSNPQPPGFPTRPAFTGVDAVDLQYPRTLPNGTRFQTFACEAAALIAAGVASYS